MPIYIVYEQYYPEIGTGPDYIPDSVWAAEAKARNWVMNEAPLGPEAYVIYRQYLNQQVDIPYEGEDCQE